MNEVCTKYTAWKGENAGNPSLALARNEIPGECGSLPVEYRIVNGRCGGSFKHSLSRIIGPMTERPLNLRDRIRRISLGFVVLLLGIAILVFAVDLGLFRLRMLAHRDPYGSVVVSHYYAVRVERRNLSLTHLRPRLASMLCFRTQTCNPAGI